MTKPTLQCRVFRVLALHVAASLPAVSRSGARPRKLGALGAGVCLLLGCAASAQIPTAPASVAQEAASTGIATVESSPFVLVPQPEGEPLPPPNRAVAGNWPADVRKLIVALVGLFPHAPTRRFDLQEIADTLHIRLEPQPVFPRLEGVEREYAIWGWALDRPEADGRASLIFMRPQRGEPFVIAAFMIDTSRYCINPYEFAVYIGARYSPLPPLDGFAPRSKPSEPQYQWGMFGNRTPTRTYVGSAGPAIATDGKCISAFTVKSHEPEAGQ